MSDYSETFKTLQPKFDPRHIEAYVRLEYRTMGHLSIDTLRREARLAAKCIQLDGLAQAERLAVTFGL